MADAATMAAGYMVSVHNNSAGNITIARATGADKINGAAKNLSLGAQQRASFRVNAAADGYIVENATPLLLDSTDPSKQAKLDLSAITTGTVRTLTLLDANVTLLSTATQAEQESGASTTAAVTAGRQQFHPSAAKAWVKHDDGTTINASYNVSSITDDGAGSHTVNFSTSFSSAHYCAVHSPTDVGNCFTAMISTQNTGSCALVVRSAAGTLTDVGSYYAAFFGDQ